MSRTPRVSATYTGNVGNRYDVTAGCDTDKSIVVIAIYNALTGSIQTTEYEQTTTGALDAADDLLAAQVQFAIIESTANYHIMFYETLRLAGVPIVVINPLIVKSLLRVEGKSDKADAMTLARLAASFQLKTSNMPDRQQKELRLVYRLMDKDKQQRTRITNQILAQLTAVGCTVYRDIDMTTPSGLAMLRAMIEDKTPLQVVAHYRFTKRRSDLLPSIVPLPLYLRDWLSQMLSDYDRINARIDATQQSLMDKIAALDLTGTIQLMCTVPGIKPLLALRIVAECGSNLHVRYTGADAFAKALGVVPSNEVSGGKLLKRKSSHGNQNVKMPLLQTAKAISLHIDAVCPPEWVNWFVKYKARAGFMKATSALARRMAEFLYWVMYTGKPFQSMRKVNLPAPLSPIEQVNPEFVEVVS